MTGPEGPQTPVNPFEELRLRGQFNLTLLNEAESCYQEGNWRAHKAPTHNDFGDSTEQVTADVDDTLNKLNPPLAFAGYDTSILEAIDSRFQAYKARRNAAIQRPDGDAPADQAERLSPSSEWSHQWQLPAEDHTQMPDRPLRMSDFSEPPEIVPPVNHTDPGHNRLGLFSFLGPDGPAVYTYGGYGSGCNHFVDDLENISPLTATSHLAIEGAIQAGHLAPADLHAHQAAEGKVEESSTENIPHPQNNPVEGDK